MLRNDRNSSTDTVLKLCAWVVIFVGLVVLGGWAFSIDILKTLGRDLPKMSASTALSFAIVGAGVLVLTGVSGRNRPALSWLARMGLTVVFAVALLRFSEHFVDWNLGVLSPWFGAASAYQFGRMAVHTAVCFLLTTFGLLLMDRWHQTRYPAAVALLGITIASLGTSALISYMGGFASTARAPGMAVHTACLFVFLAIAMIAEAWRESGQHWLLSRRVTAAFTVSGILILSVSLAGYKITNQQFEENHRLAAELQRRAVEIQRNEADMARETMAEMRHVLFAGVAAALGLFAGVLWLLNREVTERRIAELKFRRTERETAEALRESEERFRQMAENIESVFWMCSADLNHFLYVSPACRKVWGVTAEELHDFGLYFLDRVHPEDHERVTAQLARKQFIQKAGFDLEYRVLRQDGSVGWVRHRGFPIGSDSAELKRLVGTAEDITERKEAEVASYVSQERFRSVWERSADGMRLTDKDGRIIAVNEAYCRLMKLPREKLEGCPFSVTYSGHGPDDGMDTYVRRFESGDIVPRLEARVQLWNADYVDLEISNSFLELGSHGRALLSIFRDSGERRRLEEQLRQAQKMEAIGRLAGGVAHDFNNLLLVMRTHAELILMDDALRTHQAVEGLEQITSAADKAANLTRQLLAFSRKQVMQSQPLLLNDIVANLTKMLNRIIGEDVRLECRYNTRLPLVQADAGMLEQVIINLVVNARDAMPNGGEVLIGTEKTVLNPGCERLNAEARPGEFVCLTVTDTGTGIAPEHLPRIFEPFFTTKELGKGTGLGLATVYGIVKQHGGWIEVASALSAGTTFKVFLPALPGDTGHTETLQTPREVRRGSETILLVEDEDAVRAVIKESLETYGYTIFEANCAREALMMWNDSKGKIDLLLTDIVMPEGINGRDLAERIRANNPKIGVIFMSGYSPDIAGKDTSFFRRSKTAFLQKPFPATALLETVRQCVETDEIVAAN